MRKLFAVLPMLLLAGCDFSPPPESSAAETQPAYTEEFTKTETATEYTETTGTTEYTEPAETTQLTAGTEPTETAETSYLTELTGETTLSTVAALDPDGSYTTKEDVSLYIYTYGELPKNFITKKEAQELGWTGGSLEPYAPGCCIGGSRFGNYENLLPTKKGRFYTECDIDTLGKKSRGAKRIVFSNDGLIYYTADHYETFELLYGEVNT